jgi:hypothetical protein
MNTVTFKNDDIDGDISLNENRIYIKLKRHVIDYCIYEINSTKENYNISNMFDLNAIYEMMRDCVTINSSEKHCVFNVEPHGIKMEFHILCYGHIKFNVFVDKLAVSNTNNTINEMMMRINNMEKQYLALKEENDAMKKQINDNLCNAVVKFGPSNEKYSYSFNETALNIHISTPNTNHDFTKLILFSDLNDLTINMSIYDYCLCDRTCECNKSIFCNNARNNNLRTLTLHNTMFSHGQPYHETCRPYIEKLFNLDNFPNLEDLTIVNANTLTTKILIDAMKSQSNKITKLKITTCILIDMTEMQSYCQSNDIILSS